MAHPSFVPYFVLFLTYMYFRKFPRIRGESPPSPSLSTTLIFPYKYYRKTYFLTYFWVCTILYLISFLYSITTVLSPYNNIVPFIIQYRIPVLWAVGLQVVFTVWIRLFSTNLACVPVTRIYFLFFPNLSAGIKSRYWSRTSRGCISAKRLRIIITVRTWFRVSCPSTVSARATLFPRFATNHRRRRCYLTNIAYLAHARV